MAKAFCVPALIVSFCAIILLLLVTISLPTTLSDATPFDFVRGNNLGGIRDEGSFTNTNRELDSIRLGTWGYCTRAQGESGYGFCHKTGIAYSVDLRNAGGSNSSYSSTMIKPSWTRGLVLHVIAFVVSLVGFALSFFPHLIVQLVASLATFLAALFALLAFIIDIVLFVYARNRIHDIAPDADVMPGPGFYMTLVAIPLLLLAGLTVCYGRRKDKRDGGYVSADTTASDSFPLKSSRQKVLDAFHSSKA